MCTCLCTHLYTRLVGGSTVQMSVLFKHAYTYMSAHAHKHGMHEQEIKARVVQKLETIMNKAPEVINGATLKCVQTCVQLCPLTCAQTCVYISYRRVNGHVYTHFP